MNDIVFEYAGRHHKGQIISSTDIEPHYYWFYFKDEVIPTIINDDCIGFKKRGNQLLPTKTHTAHLELVETVKEIIEKNLL